LKLGPFHISWVTRPEREALNLERVNDQFREFQATGKKLLLGTLCARSGTRWLCDIVKSHDRAYAVTERDATPESFWRYIKYNELPIESDGIVRLLKKRIVDDWQANDLTLIFSPYFSHGLRELVQELSPTHVIFGVAEPEFVVQSIYNKGIFSTPYPERPDDVAIGFQPEFLGRWSHFYGRIVPRGPFYNDWLELTQVGKIAWWVNRINMDIYEQLESLSPDQVILFDLPKADQNYEYYTSLAAKLGLRPILSRERFLALKKETAKSSDNVKHTWTAEERTEFEQQIAEWQRVYARLSS